MKKNYKIIALCILSAFALVMFASPVVADVGNYNDYGSGSGYSGSSGSSSSSSGDITDLLFLVYIIYDAFGPIGGTIVLAIVAVCIYLFGRKNFKKLRNHQSLSNLNLDQMQFSNIMSGNMNFTPVAEQLQAFDPNFSESNFITFANEVFTKLQNAWSNRDWKIIRPFESNELFSVHNMQLQEYIDNKKINKIEKIAILDSKLISFKQEGGKDFIVLRLTARFKDYVVEEKTNKVLESDPNKLWTMTYDMTFSRTTGVLTKINQKKSTTNCPNCGAPTEITSAGMCEYCGSVITTGNHDWVLTDYKKSM